MSESRESPPQIRKALSQKSRFEFRGGGEELTLGT